MTIFPLKCQPLAAIFVLSSLLQLVSGHGLMIEPPSRTSAWRVGFRTPSDVDDNGHNCGGLGVQWVRNGGKCGICGDPYNSAVKASEAPGGRFATGTIVRSYVSGQLFTASIILSANHRGFFEFKMCANNNVRQDPTQQCFDRLPLKLIDGQTKFFLPAENKMKYDIQLQLPDHVSCSQCIIQWTYTAGNNWGFCGNGTGAMGCGPQEMFRACADVSIVRIVTPPSPTTTTTTPTTTPSTLPASTTTKTTTATPVTAFNCPLTWGLFANPVDCRSFYSCGHGVPYLMYCPLGLHFNQNLSVCDWPVNVQCAPHHHSHLLV